MKYVTGILSLLILINIFVLSCSSLDVTDRIHQYSDYNTDPLAVSDESNAQVIVTRLDNDGGNIAIFIDGEYAGKLGNGQTGLYKMTTGGIHKITAKYDEYIRYNDGTVLSGLKTDSIEFIYDDIACHFYVKYIGRKYWGRAKGLKWHDLHVELTQDNNSLIATGQSSSNPVINETFRKLSKNIHDNSRIAIVNVTSNNRDESNFIIDELTVVFVNVKKYFVVDRNRLQVIMDEQNFQMSGYVDDNSIVSIGHFAGADVVLTGNINSINGKRRLVFRALDVKTARILAMSSVDLE
ncbi:hypothetical protein FACS189494_05000 [Spirochaetia bacterium]|nr:hypothetical protein FACS189494_05000 [Spirochaetia bacterium]